MICQFKDIPFTTDWKQVEVEYEPSKGGDFLLVQCDDFVGDIYIKNIILSKEGKTRKVTENRRCVVVDASARVNAAWDNQFWIVTDGFKQGAQFEFSADVRADANKYYFDNISFKVNGKELLKNGNLEGTDVSSFIVKDSETKTASPKIADQISYLYTPSPVPLTDQEKHDTLVYAMDKWISGMMQACNGKVKAWDVVNEAISGGDNDGDGYYDLQHSDGYKSGTWDVGGDAFYWQDYMGDLEYVRQAVRLARKYGPEDVKLFVNDYNLESFWDNNKKLRSLIHWIKKWEADGVTKIDGIGTQMHISCSMDDNTLNNRKKYIKQMFQLMAQSGKLVRVSEFDMGMDDANGNAVSTANMTEAMHQRMADYYEWIVKTYLEIIPADQQWGICQWCMTDSPANSGWRANTPVGIWTLNDFYRKHAYAGYVRGLGGIVYAGINSPVVNTQVLSFKKGIYTLDGVKLKYAPQCGVYIQNGKKIVKSTR